ncbi:MAG: class I SAM-dependent methyltransferase [Candidatus Acidiferrum sp.]
MQSLTATLSHAGISGMPELSPRVPGEAPSMELRCPECHEYLASISYRSLARDLSSFSCGECSTTFKQEHGIWLALPPSRQAYFAQFIREYKQIRRAEGRGSTDSDFYLALPFRDLTGSNSWQWAIRGKTFRYIEQAILPKLSRKANAPLTILDLGAGNGWMSHRLARLGHRPVAVDLLTNSDDGLGAAFHYQGVLPELFPRFQAELDHLPFADEQFDCGIFNASFHYSEDYDRTLAETIRCLRPGGTILVADSPTYSTESGGQQMQQERQDSFLKRFGFRSDALNSCEYLTPERLMALEVRHNLEWSSHRIWYGLRWACRPWLAKWKKRREPSQLVLYTAEVKAQ